MPQRVGWMGGSFDPPHVGHVAMAEAAIQAAGLDRVLLAPAGRQPLKKDGAEAPFADRMRMVELLCAGADPARMEASDVDAARPDGEPNYTAETLERLRAEMPGVRLFGVVGADSFLEMRHWRWPERLMAAAEWVVVSRPGSELPVQLEAPLRENRVLRVTDVNVPVASRVVRERLRRGESCEGLVPAAVLRYIRERGLYGTDGG